MPAHTSVAPPAESTPTVAGHSPGQTLAAALAEGADEIALDLPVSLPTTFPFFAARPRYTVRHLLGTTVPAGDTGDTGDDGVPYVHEPAASHAPAVSGTSYTSSPEAAFEPRIDRARLAWVSALVTLPDGLTDHPDLLASHIDRRVVVRLCTVENQALLYGGADGAVPGLLRVPGRRTARGTGRPEDDLARAAALAEETGGSCDGAVVHPDLYWRLAVGGTLARLNEVGVRVSRTRMIARDQALLGDFRAVATLLDPARSRLVLRRGRGGGVVEAAHQVGLAVHLPQHLVLLELGAAP
jgi:hypothetical protein